MGGYSFLGWSLALVLVACMRPWLTLCVLSQLIANQAIEGFVLPHYLSWISVEPTLTILMGLAVLEIILDMSYTTISGVMQLLRPLFATIPVLAVMHFSNTWLNIITTIAFCLLFGIPFNRFFNSLFVPRNVHRADQGLRIKDQKDLEKHANLSHTITVSIIQDFACAGIACLSCVNFSLSLIVILAGIAYLESLRKRLTAKLNAIHFVTPESVRAQLKQKEKEAALRKLSNATAWATQPTPATAPNTTAWATQPAPATAQDKPALSIPAAQPPRTFSLESPTTATVQRPAIKLNRGIPLAQRIAERQAANAEDTAGASAARP